MLEFALVGPAFIVMLMGVLQVGIAMQNYNALRNVSADVARYAMIQYTTGNRLTNDQLNSYATTVAQSAPYLLNSRIIVTIDDVATPASHRPDGEELVDRLPDSFGAGDDGPERPGDHLHASALPGRTRHVSPARQGSRAGVARRR
jgi:hypothetical protein